MMHVSSYPLVAKVAAVVICALSANASAAPAENLFVISRSLNANIVRYDVHRTAGGKLDLEHPVDAYWLMAAQDGRREELTFMERQFAYGFSVSGVGAAGFSLRLTAFKQREVRVESLHGTYRPRVLIGAAIATLRSIYVKTDEGGGVAERAVCRATGQGGQRSGRLGTYYRPLD